MGRKKLNLSEEEKKIRRKMQWKKAYDKRREIINLKRRVENLAPEKIENERKRKQKYYANMKMKKQKLIQYLHTSDQKEKHLDTGNVNCKYFALTFTEEINELQSSSSRQCRIHHSPEYPYSKGIKQMNFDKTEIDQIIVVKSEPIEDESEAAIIPNTRNMASHLQQSSNDDRLCDIKLEPSAHVYSPPEQNERIGAKLQSLYDKSEVNQRRPSDCDDLLSYIKIEPTAIENSWHDLSDSSTQ